MKLTAMCSQCSYDQLVLPEEGEQDQMVRCSACNAELGDKAAVKNALREAAEKDAKQLTDDFKKKLGKRGFK